MGVAALHDRMARGGQRPVEPAVATVKVFSVSPGPKDSDPDFGV